MAVAWDTTRVDGDVYFASEHNAQTAWLKQRHKNYVGGTPADFTLTKDNNGVERKFFKDDFSNDTIANYTKTGTPTIAAGVLTMAYDDKIIKTLPTTATTGRWGAEVQFGTAYVATTQQIQLFCGTNTILATKRQAGNVIKFQLVVNGVTCVAETSTATTLADSVYGRPTVDYDGTNWQMYWNGVAVGAATAGAAPTTPSIGILNTADAGIVTVGTINSLTYVPSVAYTDLFATDTETRYMQLISADALATWTAATATGWVISGGVLTVKGSDIDEGTMGALRSYNFGSGSYQISAKNNNLTTATPDAFGIVFGYQDSANRYKAVVEEWGPSSSTPYGFKIYKTVAGTTTQLGTTAAVTASNYTRGASCYFRIDWDAERGQTWGFISATPDTWTTGVPVITDAFDSNFKYGKVGVIDTTTTTGSAGKLNAEYDNLIVRANLLIGETNVPTTETGFYFRDEFGSNSSGRMITNGTITIGGGTLTLTGATIGTYALLPIHVSPLTTFTFKFTDGNVAATRHETRFNIGVPSGTITGDGSISVGYVIQFFPSTSTTNPNKIRVLNGASEILAATACTLTQGTPYYVKITWNANNTISIYCDAVDGTTLIATTPVNTSNLFGMTALSVYDGTNGANSSTVFDNLTISGTRYYMAPILRGAQVGTYWNGTASVPCTFFGDDCNWDTSAEHVVKDSLTWTITNGALYLTNIGAKTVAAYQIGNLQFGDGLYSWVIQDTNSASGGSFRLPFCWGGTTSSIGRAVSCYIIYVNYNSSAVQLQWVDSSGAGTSLGTITRTLTSGTVHRVRALKVGSSISVYVDDETTPGFTVTDTHYTVGYGGVTSDYTNILRVLSANFNALESTSTNGVAVTIGGVPHGARYDTQEEAYYNVTNGARYGEYTLATIGKTTATPQTFELYFANTTDTTSVESSGLTTSDVVLNSTTYVDSMVPLIFRYRDRADTIKISARRKNYSGVTYDNQPAIFFDTLALAPIWEE
jgi:hypothetical protein